MFLILTRLLLNAFFRQIWRVRKDANNKDVKTETNNTFTQESF